MRNSERDLKDLTQSQTTVKISKEFGTAGLREDQPIEFNDEDELGTAGGSKKKDQAAANNEMSETARQIAALQVWSGSLSPFACSLIFYPASRHSSML
jgi:hypothetical protein